MYLPTMLLAGWLAVQEPPKPPVQSHDPPVHVDAELRAAIDELRRAGGYRFEIDGEVSSGDRRPLADAADVNRPDPQRDEQGDKGDRGERSGDPFAHAKEPPTRRESFHVTGAFQREKPVQLESGKVVAFRSNEKLAWKGRDTKEWATLRASAGGTTGEDADAGSSRSGDDARTAGLLARIPLPGDLIRGFDARLVSCERATGGDVKDGVATYECVLSSIADAPAASPRRSDAKPDARNLWLRFTVSQGRIAEIEFRPPAQRKPRDSTTAALGQTLSGHCQISDVGSAQVTVPEEAARILEKKE
jgi:hypothetical protein